MTRKIIGVLITVLVALIVAVGAGFPSSAQATHKVWMFCHAPDTLKPGHAHLHKESGVHTDYICYAKGFWVYVTAPWPH